MRAIHKFILHVNDEQTVEMPEGAEILSAQVQSGSICLWAIVEPAKPLKPRIIAIHGTGHIFPPQVNQTFIGTVQMLDGQLVFHVFESLPLQVDRTAPETSTRSAED